MTTALQVWVCTLQLAVRNTPRKTFIGTVFPKLRNYLTVFPIIFRVLFHRQFRFFFLIFFLLKRRNRKSQQSTKTVANNPFMMVIFKKPQEQSCNHTNFVWTCYYTVIVLKLFSAWEKLDGCGFLSIAAKYALQHVCQLNAPLLDVREGGPDRVGDQRLIENRHGGSDVWLRQTVHLKKKKKETLHQTFSDVLTW